MNIIQAELLNMAKAKNLVEIQKLAEQGDAQAQWNLGAMYYYGQDITQDYMQAFYWYEKAAEQGHASAQYNIGVMYDNGQGVGQDYAEALKWYKLAAAQGHAEAQYFIGDMYGDGQGVGQDDAEALRWYKLAAAQGKADAQHNIGAMYDNGQGVGQNYAEALKWYTLAAAQGYACAQYNIGFMYDMGHGVVQDDAEALKWYKLAAAQGFELAQLNIGFMYAKGRGVVQDYVRAHMWFNLVAVGGDADAVKLRDIVAAKMSSQQISEAQKLARECQAKAPADASNEVLTIQEAADYLRINKKLLYKLINAGDIPAKRVGRVYRINKAALITFMSGDTSELSSAFDAADGILEEKQKQISAELLRICKEKRHVYSVISYISALTFTNGEVTFTKGGDAFNDSVIDKMFKGHELPTWSGFKGAIRANNAMQTKAERVKLPTRKTHGAMYQHFNNIEKISEAIELGFNPLVYWDAKSNIAMRDVHSNISYILKGAREFINGA